MDPRRVAFLDDNEVVRTALAHALAALPEIELVAALEGPAELEQLVSTAPDLVLIDFHLLGARGDTFAEVVKTRLPAASIWLMTANPRGIEPSSWTLVEKGELLEALKGWLA
jgi:DNA-binding NarL/FixJ family response regulator